MSLTRRKKKPRRRGRSQRVTSIGFDAMGANMQEVFERLRRAQAQPERFTFNQAVNLMTDTALRMLRDGRLKPSQFTSLANPEE